MKNIPFSLREKYENIPWKDIAGFRDVVSHAYFGVIPERVWEIIKQDLPLFRKQIQEIQRDMAENS